MSDFSVDMNSDLGEGFGAWSMGNDADVLPYVSSVSIACGYHAGDPEIMRKTVRLCAKAGVAVGAHVSYPDLMGFGRRSMACAPDEVYCYCLYQIGALAAFCRAEGVALRHVKPHGALYNQAARDERLADAIAAAVRDSGDEGVLLGLANSEFGKASMTRGIRFASEAFADRGYMKDGSLLPRSRPGAVIHSPDEAARRVVEMVTRGVVTAVDGTEIQLKPDSICFHGDTKEAVEMARAAREALVAAGVSVIPLREVL